MKWPLLAFAAGSLIAVQAAVNARLGRSLENPMLATLVSFLVGSAFVLIYCITLRTAAPSTDVLKTIPKWAWFGGLLGAGYVATVIAATPRIGAGTVSALTVAGQMVCALLLDHCGVLGLAKHSVSPGRILGIALLIAGVALVKRF